MFFPTEEMLSHRKMYLLMFLVVMLSQMSNAAIQEPQPLEIETIISTMNATLQNVTSSRNISRESVGDMKFVDLLSFKRYRINGNLTTRIKNVFKIQGNMFLLQNLTVTEMALTTKRSVDGFFNQTLFSIFYSYNVAMQKGVEKAGQPIIVAAFNKGISISQIASQKLLDLAYKTSGIPITVIKQLYVIKDNDYIEAQSLTIAALPHVVKAKFHVDFPIKHFYTMSFSSLANAFLVHKNVSEGNQDFLKDFGFIVSKVSLSKLKLIYGINDQFISTKTIASLATFLSGITTAQLKKVIRSNVTMVTNLVDSLTFTEMTTTLKTSLALLSNRTISGLFLNFRRVIYAGLQVAAQPIVISAYDKGISISQIASQKLLDLAKLTTGLPPIVIKKLFKISDNDYTQAQSLTVGALPTLVTARFNVNFAVKHFYTMSFSSLANAFLVHKNVSEGTQDFLKDFGFIVSNVSLSKLKLIYGINDQFISTKTIASLATFLSGITTAQLKKVIRSNVTMVTNLVDSLTFTEMTTTLKTSLALLSNRTISGLFLNFRRVIYAGLQVAAQPIVISAYDKGISISQIPSQKLLDLAKLTTGLPPIVIKKLFKISDNDYTQAQSLTVGALPTLVKARFNVNFAVKHFYTMSFSSLANAFLVHKNVSEGTQDFLKDFGFIVSNVSLSKLKLIYGINDQFISTKTIASLATFLSGITTAQLKKVIRSNVTMVTNLVDSLTFTEMTTTLKTSLALLSNRTISGLFLNFRRVIYAGLQVAAQPIVISAYDKGISISQIASQKLLDLAKLTTGLPPIVIKKLFKISDNDYTQAQSLTVGALPTLVKARFNVNFAVKHFYTMSFSSLANAFLVHKNVSEGTQDFLKDFGFIVSNVSLSKLKLIYGINDQFISTKTIASLATFLSGITTAQLKKVIRSNVTMVTNLVDSLTFTEMTTTLKMSLALLSNRTISGLFLNFRRVIYAGLQVAAQPMVISAYDKGISISQIASQKLLDLAKLTTGLPPIVIKKLFKISDNDYTQAQSLTVGALPTLVTARFNVNFAVKHFYTMSFSSLANAFLVHKNVSEGTQDFLKDFGFIVSNVSLSNLKLIYGIDDQFISTKTIASLATFLSGITTAQLKKVIRSNVTMVTNLVDSLTFTEMTTTLKTSLALLSNRTISGLFLNFRRVIYAGLQVAAQPIVISAYDKGISISQIASQKLLDLAKLTTGLPPIVIKKLFKISDNDYTQAQSLTVGALPTLVTARFNVNFAVKHFYTMSFSSLANAFLVHKNVSEGTQDFLKDFGFIVSNVSLSNLKLIYGIDDQFISTKTIASLATFLSGITTAQLKKVIRSNVTMVTNLVDSLTFTEMTTTLKTSLALLSNRTISGLFLNFRRVIYAGLQVAAQPIVISAYDKGISISQIPSQKLLDLAKLTTGLPPIVIKKLFKISDNDYTQAQSLTVGALPTLVKARFNVNFAVKHFYTMSFSSLANAFLVHKNVSEGTQDFLKDFGFIVSNVSLSKLKLIYGINDQFISTKTIASLATFLSGITTAQLKKVIRSNVTMVTNLVDSLTFTEMTTTLKTSLALLSNRTISGLFLNFRRVIYAGLQVAAQPIVISAYDKGISISQIASQKLLDLAKLTTGLPPIVIKKLFKISDNDYTQAQSLTVGALPTLVTARFNVNFAVKHFYTMSFSSLANAFLVHKNVSEGTQDFLKDFGFIVSNVSLSNLKLIYGIDDQFISTKTIASLATFLSGITTAQLKKVIRSNVTMVTNLVDSLTFTEMTTTLKTSLALLSNRTISGLFLNFRRVIYAGLQVAAQPIVISAYDKGISISRIPSQKLLDLAKLTTGLPPIVIKKLFKISDNDYTQAQSLTVGALPTLVKARFNVNFAVKHFYTMSFSSLANAFLVHKNVSEGTQDFLKDFGFIVSNVSLSKLKLIYGINDQFISTKTIASLATFLSGITTAQLKKVIRSNVTMVTNLVDSLTFTEMTTTLKTSLALLSNRTISGLFLNFRRVIYAGLQVAAQPIVISAYDKGISISQIASQKLLDLAQLTTGLPPIVIKKLFKISDNDYTQAQSLTVGALPTLVKARFNVNFTVKHFFTMSFSSLANAFLVHKNVSEGTQDFLKDFGFIVSNVSLSKLKLIYGINDQFISTKTIASLATFLSGITTAQLKKVIRSNVTMVTNLVDSLTFTEMTTTLKTSLALLSNRTISGLFLNFRRVIYAGLQVAAQPIVISAYDKGISISQIASQKLLDLAQLTTGLPPIVIKKLFKISDNDYTQAQSLTVGALPTLVKARFNVNFTVKHFFTMSFSSLANAFLVHKNVSEGTQDFLKDFGFIVSNVSLSKLKLIYGINDQFISTKTIASLATFLSGITTAQLKKVIRSNVTMVTNLVDSLTFTEMTTTLKTSLALLSNRTMSGLFLNFRRFIYAALQVAAQPIVISAYDKGISISQIASQKLLDLAKLTTGLPPIVIKKLFKISDNDYTQAQSLTVGALPTLVKARFNVLFSSKHFYTMSFSSLANAFVVHKNLTEGSLDFLKDFSFIGKQISFNLLKKIYGFRQSDILKKNILMISSDIAAISTGDFSLASGLSNSQVEKLSRILMEDAVLYLDFRNITFHLNSSNIFAVLNLLSSAYANKPGFFSLISELAASSKPIRRYTLADILNGILNIDVDVLLKKLFVSKSFFNLIRRSTFQSLIDQKLLRIGNAVLSNMTAWKTFASIANMNAFFEMPIIVGAYRTTVTVSSVQNGDLTSILEKIFGFDKQTIALKFEIQPSSMAAINGSSLTQLSSKILQTFGMNITVKRLYTLSFKGLFEAVFKKPSLQATNKAIKESSSYISSSVTISEMQTLFSIASVSKLSVNDLFRSYFNLDKNEISFALNCSIEQEALLNRVSIGDAKIFAGLDATVMKPVAYGRRIIESGSLFPTMFTPMDEYLTKHGRPKADISKISLKEFLQISQLSIPDVTPLIHRYKMAPKTFSFVNYHKLGDFITAFQMTLQSFSKMPLFAFLKKITETTSSGRDVCKDFVKPCTANAGCYSPKGALYCRCNAGFSGNGTSCVDGCSTKSCNDESVCVNVRDSNPVCRCKKKGFIMKNNKCLPPDGDIFKVTGMKLNQPYKDTYGNRDSQDFKTKAAEIENLLETVLCRKINGCVAVRVAGIKRGSIVVDYNIILSQNAKNTSKQEIFRLAQASVSDPGLSDLSPEKSSSLKVEASNVCEAGAYDCDVNSKCVPGHHGKYTCKCNNGYVKKGNSCQKSSSGKAVAIAVPVVIVIIILILVMVVFARKYKGRIQRTFRLKQKSPDVPFQTFSGGSEIELRTK